jgi:hypothetical protein
MKMIRVNEIDVMCSHEIKGHEIHLTVKAEDVQTTHVLTIGAEDGLLPEGYGQAELQRDLDVFREKHARLTESKLRARKLAQDLN